MRAFIVLCLVAAACADQLGYNYQPVGHGDEGLSFTSGSGSIGGGSFGGSLGGSSLGGGSLGGGSLGGGSLGGGSFGGSLGGSSFGGSLGGGSLGGGSFGGSLGGGSLGGGSLGGGSFGGAFGSGNSIIGGSTGGFSGGHAPAVESEFNKEFYSFTAPEHEFEDHRGAHDVANSLKKNLQVIFIKGPENKGLEHAALSLAKHANDQRTAIYVLNKQTDIGDLAHKLNAANNNNQHKPEVHFVKYRTPEDAANAQRAIQSQYDQLGGTSQSHHGGVAPVLNFASPAQVHAPAPHAPGNAYLPSSIFRHRK